MLTPLGPRVTRSGKKAPTAAPPSVPRLLSPGAAIALMGAVVLVWGVNWPVMKVGLQDIPPLSFASMRMLLGALCLFGILALRGGIRLPAAADLPVVLTVGLLQLAAFLAFITLGLQYVEAGRSAILCYTTPIWVAPLAAAFAGEKLNARKLIGLALGLGGIAVLFNPVTFDWQHTALLMGNGFLLAGALAWAIAIVHIRSHRFRAAPLAMAPWQMLVGCVPVAILALIFEDPGDITTGPRLWAVLAYNGPFATAFALWAWVTVNRALSALTTSMVSLAVPATGLLASALWLGEAVTPEKGAGLALIIVGVAVITLAALDRDTPEEGPEKEPSPGAAPASAPPAGSREKAR